MGHVFRMFQRWYSLYDIILFPSTTSNRARGKFKKAMCFLAKFKCGAIRDRVQEHESPDIPEISCDWELETQADYHEVLPADVLDPLGKHVETLSFRDVKMCHNLVTGRCVTASS